MIFGSRLKELREKLGFTQQEVAGKLKVSRSTIGKYETNSAYPDIEKLIALSLLYDCSVDYLLGIIDTPNKFTDVELQLFSHILDLLSNQGLIRFNDTVSSDEAKSILEQIKTACHTITLLKRINDK